MLLAHDLFVFPSNTAISMTKVRNRLRESKRLAQGHTARKQQREGFLEAVQG